MPKRVDVAAGSTALGESRDGFRFRAGRLALDFAATLAARLKPVPRELLAVPKDLERWLAVSELAFDGSRATAVDLASARALREALYRLAVARIDGGVLVSADRALVNVWAARPVPAPQVGNDRAHGLKWTGGDVPACLAAIAQDGVTLVSGPLALRIRECAREGCSLLFLDTSRSGERRWCSMRACGNKEKVSNFRRRNAIS